MGVGRVNLELKFPGAVERVGVQVDKPVFQVEPARLVEICQYLHDEEGFDHLSLISGVDYQEYMEVVYHLWSVRDKKMIVLKVKLPRGQPEVDSLCGIWKGADWMERETYDLVGIIFRGHPNLKRILLPEGWEGHPLRRDYDMDREQFVVLTEEGEDLVTTDGSMLLRRGALEDKESKGEEG